MASSVRLNCTLCPKRPEFSDISHLLTHLASKGHLSHYFKAQVKSRQNAQIAHELRAFDKWYTDNDMEQLLHERLIQKEKKKAAKTINTSGSGNNKRPLPKVEDSTPQPSRQDSTQAVIDPQLDEAFQPSSGRYSLRQNSQRMRYRASNLQNVFDTISEEVEDPPLPRALSVETEQEVELNEYVTLKGVVWPGMDLFDSASPHAKRIRNQKKDSSCLEQMRTYAETIEPNEDIYYYPSWQLKQSREITGQVESSSPERGEPPPRAQKPRGRAKRPRGRPPLMSLDVNQSPTRCQGRRAQKGNAFDFGSGYGSSIPFSPLDQMNSLHGHGSLWTNPEDDLDWSLTFDPYGQMTKRSNAPIFRDDDSLQLRQPPQGQQPHDYGRALDRDFDKENKDPNADFFGSFFDPKGEISLEPNPQRYFSMDTTANMSQVSRTAPPFLDFMMGYPTNPMQSPLLSQQSGLGNDNPLGMQQGGSAVQVHQQLKQPNPVSGVLNPLLDFSSLLKQETRKESDDETIDERVEDGSQSFVRAS